MSQSDSAVLAGDVFSNPEVPMAKALKVTRARPSVNDGPILIKRDRKPDIQIASGRLLLTVETEPSRTGDPERRLAGAHLGGSRWRVWRLYINQKGDRAVVAAEGHSDMEGETTRYTATVCVNGAEVWEAMGKYDDLKPVLAELGWPAVEEV